MLAWEVWTRSDKSSLENIHENQTRGVFRMQEVKLAQPQRTCRGARPGDMCISEARIPPQERLHCCTSRKAPTSPCTHKCVCFHTVVFPCTCMNTQTEAFMYEHRPQHRTYGASYRIICTPCRTAPFLTLPSLPSLH